MKNPAGIMKGILYALDEGIATSSGKQRLRGKKGYFYGGDFCDLRCN
jgi:hypothetical protein